MIGNIMSILVAAYLIWLLARTIYTKYTEGTK
ncbi:hypothetical protein J2S10_004975 [Neobacillus ginsengisoli]|uniref:Type I toxin-antitoxin system Fst family toxin n=1 Tax=Neobacillus ginsengisoli TaxID=904295 RepID=A0ABT9Y2K1_9BACI|nr:hypothetical protein [Neobacillus ginsengisoli]